MKSKSNTMFDCTQNGNFSLSKHILSNSNNLLGVLDQCNIQCIFKNGFNHLLVLTQRSYIVTDKIIDVLIHQVVVEFNNTVEITCQFFVCILAGNRLNSRSICVREVDNRTSIRKNRAYFLKIIGRHKHRAMFKAYKSCFQIVVIYIAARFIGNREQFI